MAHLSSHQASPQHQSSASIQKQQRRMTSPASSASLNPPDDPRPRSGRPPSPLRNGFVPDTFTGIDPEDFSDEDDFDSRRKWTERSPSPASSVSQLAASFTQRVGNFLGNMAPRSPGSMLSDAELEAEAERERDRSRREAEKILTREAEERKLVEERVLALMQNTTSLPPPPSRSQTMSNPPSPSSSPKESWWATAKNKLTPTKEKDKEPLTPAQQVIQETKARDKDKKGKGKEKEKERQKEWPADLQAKYDDPTMSNLNIPLPPVHRKPVPPSPSSPTPSRPNLSNMPPNLTPSPMRVGDAATSSPSKEPPLLYAQFNPQGTLDVPATLLTIAKRFEKLEKWTVGHVRALEERMGDVERWLVDKEKDKEREEVQKVPSDTSLVARDMQDMKDGLTELQSRVGELGREMAKLATAPSNLSSGPSRQTGPVSVAPQTSSTIVVHENQDSAPTTSPVSTPHHSRLVSVTARESTSPPMASSKSSGTRLPYPTGDYATPPDSTAFTQGPFSPPHSPPSSMSSASRTRPISVTGLPNAGAGLGIIPKSATSTTSSPQAISPKVPRITSPTLQGLPLPARSSPRPSSASPTPRKRYTVALGEPIVSPPDLSSQRRPSPHPPLSSKGNATLSDSLNDRSEDENEDDNDRNNEFQDETIGKSSSARYIQPTNGDYKPTTPLVTSKSSSPSPKPLKHKLRAQSVYGLSSLQPPQTPITPLKPRLRTRSTDRLAPGPETSFPTGKFVDPLLLRKQDKEKERDTAKIAMPKPVGKVPIGQLVAFFDGEKKDRA